MFQVTYMQHMKETLLYTRYYAKACKEWRGPSPRHRASQQHSFEKALQWCRAVGDTVSDLTEPGIEP